MSVQPPQAATERGNLNFVAIYLFLGKRGVNHSRSIAAVDVRKPHALLPLSKQASYEHRRTETGRRRSDETSGFVKLPADAKSRQTRPRQASLTKASITIGCFPQPCSYASGSPQNEKCVPRHLHATNGTLASIWPLPVPKAWRPTSATRLWRKGRAVEKGADR